MGPQSQIISQQPLSYLETFPFHNLEHRVDQRSPMWRKRASAPIQAPTTASSSNSFHHTGVFSALNEPAAAFGFRLRLFTH